MDRGTKRPPSSPPENESARRKYQREQLGPGQVLNKSLLDQSNPRSNEATGNAGTVTLGPRTQTPRQGPDKPVSEHRTTTSSISASPVDTGSRRGSLSHLTRELDHAAAGHSHNDSRSDQECSLRPGMPPQHQSNDVPKNDVSLDSFIDALLGFQNQSSILAAFETSRLQAEAQLNRNTREYKSMQPQFGSFPGIQEQRQAAKEKAAAHLERQQELCDEQRTKQMNIARTLSDTMLTRIRTKLLSRTDFVSRDDHGQLETRVAQLEKMFESKNNEVQLLRESNARLSEQLDASNTRHKNSGAGLEKRVSDNHAWLQQAVDALRGRFANLEAWSENFKTSQKTIASEFKDQVAKLESRLREDSKSDNDGLKEDLKRFEDQVSTINEKLGDVELQDFVRRAELQDLASRVDSGATRLQLLQEAAEREQRSTERVTTSMSAHVASDADDRLAKVVYDIKTMEDENENRDQAIYKIVGRNRDEMDAKYNAIVGDLKTIQEDITILTNGRGELHEAVRTLKTQGGPAPRFVPLIGQSPSGRVLPAIASLTNIPEVQFGQTATFTPRTGHTDFQKLVDDVRRVQESVTMLEQATREHKRVIDNMTTDAVAKQMMDQFSDFHHPAKTIVQTLESITSSITDLQMTVGKHTRLNVELTTSVKDMQEEISRIKGRLRVLET